MTYYPRRYNYPNQKRKPIDKPSNVENVIELARPILHCTMFGVAPREIMGEKAFKEIKREAQKKADHHCEICGRFVSHTKDTGDWLYTHECFEVNHEKHEYTFKRFICICHECHLFIHQGFLNVMLEDKKVNQQYVDKVLKHGEQLLQLAGYKKQLNLDVEQIYYLSYKGQRYINDYFPDIAKKAYLRGLNIIHWKEIPKILPEDWYYHSFN